MFLRHNLGKMRSKQFDMYLNLIAIAYDTPNMAVRCHLDQQQQKCSNQQQQQNRHCFHFLVLISHLKLIEMIRDSMSILVLFSIKKQQWIG